MPIRDLLLQLTSYPEATPSWAIKFSVELAEHFGARLSSALCQVHIPEVSNWLADMLIQANEAIQAENKKSLNNAQHLLSEFVSIVDEHCRGEQFLIDCKSTVFPDDVATRARSFDLTIIPVIEGRQDHQAMAEGVVFDSGRPVLLLPHLSRGWVLKDVAVGWDGSRAAARALAEALPICAAAKTVRLLQVTGDKDINSAASPMEAKRHLAAHGIEAHITELAACGLNAGKVLTEYCADNGIDLLVMGAYGSRPSRWCKFGGGHGSSSGGL